MIDRIALFAKHTTQIVEINYKKILTVLLVIQSMFLVLFFAENGFQVIYQGDSISYVAPAKNFLETGKFLDENSNPILFRTPGYSLFLALVYLITNYSDTVVVVLQMLMVLGTSCLIFSLVADISRKKWMGCAAVFFYVCELTVYTNASCILTDTIFPFLLVLALWMLYKYYKKHNLGYFIGCVVFLNYALLVRPQIMYYNMILAIVLVLLAILKKIGWRECAIYCCIFVLIFGGWSFRNYCVFGEATYSSVRAESYYLWYAPETYSLEEGVSKEDADRVFDELMDEKYVNYEQLSKIEQVQAEKDIGLTYINEHISAYLLLNIKGLVTELVAPDMSTIYSWNLPVVLCWFINCCFGGLLLLSYLIYAVGFLRSFTKHTWFDWLILLTVMYLMASTAVLGYSRFRLAFYPLCLIGTFSCWKLRTKKEKK